MFTGIVEVMGQVAVLKNLDTSEDGGNGVSLTIKNAADILSDCHLGDSIAVNGTCLTVTSFDKDSFKVGIAPETLKRTNLGDLKEGSFVNLERAMSSEVRFGGHMVQGHVDTIIQMVNKVPEGNAIKFTFKLRDGEFINYIVHKGFVCIDGVSLTVTGVDYTNSTFSIMMVAYTQTKVVIALKEVGDWCNLEVDVTGKLIARQVELNLLGQLENSNSRVSQLINDMIDQKLKSS